MLERLRKAGLAIEPCKTHIARKEVVFIGHMFSKHGIKTDPANIDKVKHFPTLRGVRDVRSFLGLSNYYRRFVASYADKSRSLNNLLKKQVPFEWADEANTSFEALPNKESNISIP